MNDHNIDLRKVAFAVIILIGISYCARIYGLSEYKVAVLQSAMMIAIICIAAVVIWYVYKFLIVHLIRWFDDAAADDGEQSGMYPLFSVLGKLIIAICAVWYIMSYLGIDLLVILTSAGIIGLAITFGAQSTLSQFFSGLNVLLARPFKAGDVIRLNYSPLTYRVRKVGLMNTTLEEWDTSEPYVVPNNVIAGATVNNVTGERRAFCALIYTDIYYEADLDRAKEIILKAAERTENIILDGSQPYPKVIYSTFDRSYLRSKLTVFGTDFDIHSPIISDLIQNIMEDLRENDIGFANTKYDVYMFGGSQ